MFERARPFILGLLVAAPIGSTGQVTLTNLGGGLVGEPVITGISNDLRTFIVSGWYGPACYWYDGQFQPLQVPGASVIVPCGVTPAGDRFAVRASTPQGATTSYLWDRGGAGTQIGGSGDPRIYAISPDGLVAYSESQYWTAGSGWQALGANLYVANLGRGLVTEDGRLVAQQWPVIGLWSSATGFVPVVTVQGTGSVNISGLSPNGTHLVGHRNTFFGDLARVWPVDGQPFDLGFGLAGPSRATSSSRDGKVIVGCQFMPIFGWDPFLWSARTGKISLRDYLAANGVEEVHDWVLCVLIDGSVPSSPWISPDGRKIVGVGSYRGTTPSYWMAEIGDITDAGPATVSGRIEFRGLAPEAILPMSVTVDFLDIGTRAIVRSAEVSLSSDGQFTAVGPTQAGPYSLSLKHTHWLRRSVDIDTSNGNVNGVLLRLVNGDVDEDNEVSIGDYAILSTAYGTVEGGPGWVDTADLDENGEVDIGDYSQLSANYGIIGDD